MPPREREAPAPSPDLLAPESDYRSAAPASSKGPGQQDSSALRLSPTGLKLVGVQQQTRQGRRLSTPLRPFRPSNRSTPQGNRRNHQKCAVNKRTSRPPAGTSCPVRAGNCSPVACTVRPKSTLQKSATNCPNGQRLRRVFAKCQNPRWHQRLQQHRN